MRKHVRSILFMMFLMVLWAVPGFAQVIGGSLTGTVTNDQGAVIVGATVKLTSHNTGITSQSITDEAGRFRFPSLDNGTYKLVVTKESYQDYTIESLTIALGSKNTLPLMLKPATFSGEVEIVATTPVIETSKTTIDTVVGSQVIDNLPLFERDYKKVILTLNNTSNFVAMIANSYESENSLNVSGGRSGSNIFQIDGANAASALNGEAQQFYSLDVVDELQLATAGFNAEYGRGTGGIVNVVTKSGGDRFSGRGSFYYRDDSLDTNTDYDWHYYEASVLFGGPIKKKELYFLGNFVRTERQDTQDYILDYYIGELGKQIKIEFNRNAFFGKLNWYPNESNEFAFTTNYEPSKNKTPYSSSLRPERDGYTTEQGGTSVLGHHKLTISNDMLLESNFNVSKTEISTVRNTESDPPSRQYWFIPSRTGQGSIAGYMGPVKTDSTNKELDISAATKLQYFMDEGSWGTQSYVFGGDISYTKLDCFEELYTQYVNLRGVLPPTEAHYYKYQTVGDPNFDFAQTAVAAYAQDDWQLMQNFTLNLGLRYDYNDFLGNGNISPRLGFAWDPLKTQKAVIRGGVGIYYDRNFFQNQRLVKQPSLLTWNDPSGKFDKEGTKATYYYVMGDDINTPYTMEASLGLEYMLLSDTTIGVDLIYRENKDQFFKYYTNLRDAVTGLRPDPNNPRDKIVFGNQGWSDYKAVAVSLNKRFDGTLMTRLEYTYSESVGNGSNFFGYGSSSLIWATQQNQDSWINGSGPTNYDIPHQFKATLIYVFPFEIMFSGNYLIRTGGPVTVSGDITGPNALPEPINTARLPFYKKLDIRLQKTFSIDEYRKISIYFDMMNALNDQNIIYTDRWRERFGEPNPYFLSKDNPYGSDYTDRDRESQIGIKIDF